VKRALKLPYLKQLFAESLSFYNSRVSFLPEGILLYLCRESLLCGLQRWYFLDDFHRVQWVCGHAPFSARILGLLSALPAFPSAVGFSATAYRNVERGFR
jgi:hypothetical protein